MAVAETGARGVGESEQAWWIATRRQAFAGEDRANLVRIVAIALFYLVELANARGLSLGIVELPKVATPEFHRAITAIAAAWVMMGLAVQLCLRSRVFPSWLGYATTAGDLVLLTSMLLVGSAAQSPLLPAYFIVLGLAALRFDVGLIRFGTVGAMAGYLVLVGYGHWFAPQRGLDVPRFQQVLMVLALGLVGVTLGQMVRAARQMMIPTTRP